MRRGFWVSPAAIWESEHKERGLRDPTYGNDLGANERESSVVEDGPPPEKAALCARDPLVLNKRAWVLPVAETDPIVGGATSEVNDNTQYDQTADCEHLDRTDEGIGKSEQKGRLSTHAK